MAVGQRIDRESSQREFCNRIPSVADIVGLLPYVSFVPTADLHNAPALAIRYAGVEPEATATVKQKLIE
jgi:hypothetical protein